MSLSNRRDVQALTLLLKSTLLKGAFRLTKFYSNVKSILTVISIRELSSVTVDLDRQQTEVQKAFRVFWDGQSYNVRFKVSGWQGKATRHHCSTLSAWSLHSY
ncbi:uncharacterized protein DEA37_0014843 [Paragonimus westermani]|uniref:Uncharacterized protein n=1 Tax=Paragonimus westermani TaxID=34504 RepID=A0A5J4NLH6_9TREM|nr:uncharacterized protein DEA37_0014843 [Paragonimus westermani]